MPEFTNEAAQMERRLAQLGHVVVSDERYEAIRSVTRRLLDGWKPGNEQLPGWWRYWADVSRTEHEDMTVPERLWLHQGGFDD
jgi:hypothetical protein